MPKKAADLLGKFPKPRPSTRSDSSKYLASFNTLVRILFVVRKKSVRVATTVNCVSNAGGSRVRSHRQRSSWQLVIAVHCHDQPIFRHLSIPSLPSLKQWFIRFAYSNFQCRRRPVALPPPKKRNYQRLYCDFVSPRITHLRTKVSSVPVPPCSDGIR